MPLPYFAREYHLPAPADAAAAPPAAAAAAALLPAAAGSAAALLPAAAERCNWTIISYWFR